MAPPPDAASSRVGWFGLPSKLLVLTLLFVMLAEVLIFVPSIASFRVNWLQDRLTSARIAAFAAEAAEGGQVPERLRAELTATAQVSAIAKKTYMASRICARRVTARSCQPDWSIGMRSKLASTASGRSAGRMSRRMLSVLIAIALTCAVAVSSARKRSGTCP
ncbi:MAG: hypothetical protein AAFV26_03440, partial [Pseudomonadota bacterium]